MLSSKIYGVHEEVVAPTFLHLFEEHLFLQNT